MQTEQATERAPQPQARTAPAAGTELAIKGMTCSNCARHVAEAIQGVPGVRTAAVQLEANQASVRWTSGAAQNVNAVIQAVEEAGYGASVVETPAGEAVASKRDSWQLNLWAGTLGTVPLMLGEWVLGLGMTRWFHWCGFVLAGAVQILAGARFYRGAWGQLKVGRSNMDTLVALGSTTAFAYSTWALFSGTGSHVYFMEAAAIITLISLGHWLEARVSARASSALRQLLNLAPALARRRNPDGDGNGSAGRRTASRGHRRLASRRSCAHRWRSGGRRFSGRRIHADRRVHPGGQNHRQPGLCGDGKHQRPAVDARDRHRRGDRLGAYHRRRAARPEQPRQHPATG